MSEQNIQIESRPQSGFSDDVTKFLPAYLAAQKKIVGAKKDSENPHLKSSYADLASVMEACKSALNENDIAIFQFPVNGRENCVTIETILMHTSGQWGKWILGVPIAKNDAQGAGSAVTYARRYCLQLAAGVCPTEDDGNGAAAGMNRQQGQQRQQNQQRSNQQQNSGEGNQRVADQQQDAAPKNDDKKAMTATQHVAFTGLYQAAFKKREFSEAAVNRAIAAVLKAKNISDFKGMTLADGRAMVAKISDGSMDKFKQEPSTPIAGQQDKQVNPAEKRSPVDPPITDEMIATWTSTTKEAWESARRRNIPDNTFGIAINLYMESLGVQNDDEAETKIFKPERRHLIESIRANDFDYAKGAPNKQAPQPA